MSRKLPPHTFFRSDAYGFTSYWDVMLDAGRTCSFFVRKTSTMEDCVFRMLNPHGCTNEKDFVGQFKEALKQRIGEDSYRMWFATGITFQIQAVTRDPDVARVGSSRNQQPSVMILVRGQFALDRLQKNFMTELRGAAMQACGCAAAVTLSLDQQVAKQADLDLGDTADEAGNVEAGNDVANTETATALSGKPSGRRASRRSRTVPSETGRRGRTTSLANLVSSTRPGRNRSRQPIPTASLDQMTFPGMAEERATGKPTPSEKGETNSQPVVRQSRRQLTFSSFAVGTSNQMAHAAATMAAKSPGIASPVFLSGPSGSGKTHLLSAVADTFRRHHRMRRVVHLSAEQFTNDFVSSVGSSGITAFRGRYRDADALLIDDVQFFGNKQATLRELLYTMETLTMANRPMLFSGLQAPTEIRGLSTELAGRMAAGLVIPLHAIDQSTRKTILGRLIEQHCEREAPESLLATLSEMATGDGRVLSGLVNNINLLSRMFSRMPTLDEIKRHTGELLRTARPVPTLSLIEDAVCEAFNLQTETLRAGGQTRSVTEPRMLAMYLARQMTSSAYAEIARHFGGKSHSTAISAEKNVKKWLDKGKTLGRGHASIPTQEAIDRVENLLRNVS